MSPDPKKIKRHHKANEVKQIDRHSSDFGSPLRSKYQRDIAENNLFTSISLQRPSIYKNDGGSIIEQRAGLNFDTKEAALAISRTDPSLDQIDEAIDTAELLADFELGEYNRSITPFPTPST